MVSDTFVPLYSKEGRTDSYYLTDEENIRNFLCQLLWSRGYHRFVIYKLNTFFINSYHLHTFEKSRYQPADRPTDDRQTNEPTIGWKTLEFLDSKSLSWLDSNFLVCISWIKSIREKSKVKHRRANHRQFVIQPIKLVWLFVLRPAYDS